MTAEVAKIPLYQAPDGIGYKLIELPQELVDLIESENAPATLTLTSSPTAALLKTPSKTYSLRQKNTSNGLILLRPVQTSSTKSSSQPESLTNSDQDGDIPMTTDDNDNGNDNNNDTTAKSDQVSEGGKTTVSLHAFTTLHETIELVPLEEGQEAPVAKVRGKWHERFGRTR
ncbi:hypothetical protein V8F20_008629 [Naviculisporaceae sp. PSN 640]